MDSITNFIIRQIFYFWAHEMRFLAKQPLNPKKRTKIQYISFAVLKRVFQRYQGNLRNTVDHCLEAYNDCEIVNSKSISIFQKPVKAVRSLHSTNVFLLYEWKSSRVEKFHVCGVKFRFIRFPPMQGKPFAHSSRNRTQCG